METSVESTAPANGVEQTNQAPDPRDYLARVRSDPAFAEAELTKHQSEASKLRNELKTLSPLKDIVSRVNGGAATVAQMVYEQAAIEQHPTGKELLSHYRTHGTLPTSTPSRHDESSDEYVDPVDKLSSRVEMLESMLQQVNGRQQHDRTMLAQTATQSYLQKIADEFGDDWEVIQPHVAAKAEEWERTPQGREILSSSSVATWRNLANLTRGEHMDEVLAKRAEKRVRQQETLGTEPRAHTVTSGREDPIRREEVWRPGAARKLVEDIRRREGRPV